MNVVFLAARVHDPLPLGCGLLATLMWHSFPHRCGPLAKQRCHYYVRGKRGSSVTSSAEAHNLCQYKGLARLEHGWPCPGDDMFPNIYRLIHSNLNFSQNISIDPFKFDMESLESCKYMGTAQLNLSTKLSHQT